MADNWQKRRMLFNRMKRASSRFRAAKREAIKRRWWSWCDKRRWETEET